MALVNLFLFLMINLKSIFNNNCFYPSLNNITPKLNNYYKDIKTKNKYNTTKFLTVNSTHKINIKVSVITGNIKKITSSPEN